MMDVQEKFENTIKVYTKRTNEMKYGFFHGLWRLSSFHGCDILHLSSPEALHPSNENRFSFTDLLPQQPLPSVY